MSTIKHSLGKKKVHMRNSIYCFQDMYAALSDCKFLLQESSLTYLKTSLVEWLPKNNKGEIMNLRFNGTSIVYISTDPNIYKRAVRHFTQTLH